MGDLVTPTTGPLTVTFPIPYKTVVYTIIAQASSGTVQKRWGVDTVTLNTFNITVQLPAALGGAFGGPAYYIAIGR
jgi:hypothetical protein